MGGEPREERADLHHSTEAGGAIHISLQWKLRHREVGVLAPRSAGVLTWIRDFIKEKQAEQRKTAFWSCGSSRAEKMHVGAAGRCQTSCWAPGLQDSRQLRCGVWGVGAQP